MKLDKATFFPPFLALVGLVLIWEFAVSFFAIPAYNFPAPAQVIVCMVENRAPLSKAFLITGWTASGGFVISLGLGYLLALIMAQAKWIERSLMPYALFFQTVPIVAIAPLIVQWIGYGPPGVITVVCTISLFPIIVNSHLGLSKLPVDARRLFGLYRASRWQTMLHLQIPHSIPYFLAGARTSCGLSVIGAIVGEFFTGFSHSAGLGYLIQTSSSQLKTDFLFCCIILSTSLGFLLFSITGLASGLLLRKYQRMQK